ncbi:MAG: tRNA pseudouridine(54/55) synthase Pus10 [Methanobacteriaceae archaeon]
MDSILKNKAVKIMKITDGQICDRCLGRHLSRDLPGDSNSERGEYARRNFLDQIDELENVKKCKVCFGIFENLDEVLKGVLYTINDKGIEFSTFLVGCRLPQDIMDKEKDIESEIQLEVESIKKEFNREMGIMFYNHFRKEVDFNHPQLVIMIDLSKNHVDLQINPLFLEGRYRKLVRNIPQTKWPCRKCKGKGCERCNYTGKMYKESVEELISPPVLKAAGGTESKFHGAGREDIDVKMLGKGRPFVLEIKEPLKRELDLKSLEDEINEHSQGKVEVLNLKASQKERRSAIKTSSTDTYKTYLALVELDGAVDAVELELIASLNVIEQRTPIRVSHRRADKIRKRAVKQITIKKIGEKTLELEIDCEGGLYIKELISGDEGRTQPSVSSILGTAARCVQLDVLEVNI